MKVCTKFVFSSLLGDWKLMPLSGIWTKHLKSKTELHQTVIDRTLKSLLQKGLIKGEKSMEVSVIKYSRHI